MYTIDDTGIYSILCKKLLLAAKRGVQVVCAVDGTKNEISSETMESIRKLGNNFVFLYYNDPKKFFTNFIENTLYKTVSRHHEKIIIVDDKVFTGSGNMKSEYGGPLLGENIFKDIYAIVKKGPTKGIFEFMRSTVYEEERKHVPDPKFCPFYNDTMRTYKDETESFGYYFEAPNKYKEIRKKLIKMLNSAEDRIVIVQPYFQLVRSITRAFLDARRRGVKVTIITAKDKDLIVYQYIPNFLLFKKLIEEGCEVYEDTSNFLHAKLYIIDNKKFSLGNHLLNS